MCKRYDDVATTITHVVEEIYAGNKTPSLEEIYQELEEKGTKIKMYSAGNTVRDYLDSLIAVGALSVRNTRFIPGIYAPIQRPKRNRVSARRNRLHTN